MTKQREWQGGLGHFLHNNYIEQAIAEACLRRYGYIIAKLVAVGNGDEKGIGKKPETINFHLKLNRLGFKKLNQGLGSISYKTTALALRKPFRYFGIKPYAAKHAGKTAVYTESIGRLQFTVE